MPRPIPLTVVAGLALLAGSCATEAGEDAAITTVRPTSTTTVQPETTTTTSTTTTTAPPDVDVPDGFELADGDGLLVAVPAGWLTLDLAAGELEELLDEAIAANPELAEALDAEVRSLLAQGAVFFAIEIGFADFASNVNIIRVAGEIPGDPNELEDVARDGIARSGGEVTAVIPVELPAGDALRVSYTATAPDGAGGVVDFAGVQYYLLADAGYVITVSFPLEGDEDLADAIAETFVEV